VMPMKSSPVSFWSTHSRDPRAFRISGIPRSVCGKLLDSRLDLSLEATGDLKHHLIEDVGIAFGAALADLTPPTCARYGHRVVPMDDALVEVAVDLGGRPYYHGPLPSSLYDHWFRSFTDHARATVHVRVARGRDRHHVVEAAFKALGMALHDALIDSGVVFSTKGAVRW